MHYRRGKIIDSSTVFCSFSLSPYQYNNDEMHPHQAHRWNVQRKKNHKRVKMRDLSFWVNRISSSNASGRFFYYYSPSRKDCLLSFSVTRATPPASWCDWQGVFAVATISIGGIISLSARYRSESSTGKPRTARASSPLWLSLPSVVH